VIWFEAFRHLVSVLTEAGPTGLLVGTGSAAAMLLIAVLAASVFSGQRPVAPELRVTRRILREQAGRTGVPRDRDPDAPGRTRPRGPTAALAAA
jgi:hypothetical protein